MGCDDMTQTQVGEKMDFNPRTRMGCDKVPELSDLHKQVNFNPRTRMGCDRQFHTAKGQDFEFQSTHPHGVRL